MKIAIVGCGFVADNYAKTLESHPDLTLVGVMDEIPERAEKFTANHKSPKNLDTVESLIEDSGAEVIVNMESG